MRSEAAINEKSSVGFDAIATFEASAIPTGTLDTLPLGDEALNTPQIDRIGWYAKTPKPSCRGATVADIRRCEFLHYSRAFHPRTCSAALA